MSEKASDLGGKIANSGPGKKLGRAADVVKDKAGRLGDKVIGGLETIDKVLTTDVKDLFKGSKDQKSDSDQNEDQKLLPPGAESNDKKEAPVPDDLGDQKQVPLSAGLGGSTVADGRRGHDIKAESPNGQRDQPGAPSIKLSVEQIIDNHAEFLGNNPDLADRLAKLVNAPDGKLKQELLQRILSDIENKSVIALDDLPPDSTIFDPKFKPNGSPKEMLEHVTFMRAAYESEILSNPNVEVGLVCNSKTGQLVLIKGDQGSVNNANDGALADMVREFTNKGDHWQLISHSHPTYEVGANQDLQRQPSGGWKDGAYHGDFAVMLDDSTSLGGKPVSSKIAVVTPDGIKTSEYGYDPKASEPFWTKIEDPVTGLVETKRYKSIEEYSDFIANNFDAKGNKKDQVDGKVDNAQTQVGMAPIEDISNENTQVGGKPIAGGISDKAQQDQSAVDNWEDKTQVDKRIGVVADVPTKPDGESLGSGIGGKDDQSRGNNNAKQNGKSVPAPIDFGSMEQTFGILPLGAVVKQQTASYIVYTYNGVDRIRFLATASFTEKEANKGRNYSNESRATLNSEGRPFVLEGRHRAIGAAKGGSIPLDGGGVAEKPGILDFKYSADHFADVGESVLNLKIDQSMPDVPAAVSEAFRNDQFDPAKKPKFNIEKGNLGKAKLDSDDYSVQEHFGDVNAWGQPVARYFADFHLAPDGFIDADVKMTDGGGNRSSMSGAAEFEKAVEHFKKHPSIKLQGLRSTWGDGDNLAKFNEFFKKYKALGATDEAAQLLAIKNTFSAKWAESAGFSGINITKAVVGPNGEFTSVEVTFSR